MEKNKEAYEVDNIRPLLKIEQSTDKPVLKAFRLCSTKAEFPRGNCGIEWVNFLAAANAFVARGLM